MQYNSNSNTMGLPQVAPRSTDNVRVGSVGVTTTGTTRTLTASPIFVTNINRCFVSIDLYFCRQFWFGGHRDNFKDKGLQHICIVSSGNEPQIEAFGQSVLVPAKTTQSVILSLKPMGSGTLTLDGVSVTIFNLRWCQGAFFLEELGWKFSCQESQT